MQLELIIEWDGELSGEALDALSALLAEGGSVGWEERTFDVGVAGGCWVAYFGAEAALELIEGELRDFFVARADGAVRLRSGVAEERDWMAAFREFFHAARVPPCWWVAPPWEAEGVSLAEGERLLVIEPGMGFGTGLHETTQLALALMGERLTPGGEAVDVGAGSGILSVAAARLGASRVWAIEIDVQAQENLERNLALNEVAERVEVCIGDMGGMNLPPAPLVVCNMLLAKLEAVAGRVVRAVAPGGTLIAAGFLVDEEARAVALLTGLGLTLVERRIQGEWIAFAFTK